MGGRVVEYMRNDGSVRGLAGVNLSLKNSNGTGHIV